MINSNFFNKSVQVAFLITIALFITQNAFGQNLEYGQKVYILNDQGESAIWSENFTVSLKDRSESPHDQRFLWVIQRDVETIGTGPVRYGDHVYFKSVGATVYDFSNRILSGSRGNPGVVVGNDEKRDDEGANPSVFKWEVRRSRASVGSGIVQIVDFILLKTRFEGWLVNQGDRPGTPASLDNVAVTDLQWRIEPYQKYRIGDTHAGGIIFYLDPDGMHGLVAAPSDQTEQRTGARYGCPETILIGIPDVSFTRTGPEVDILTSPGADIGWGAVNTTEIVNNCADDGNAAHLCDELVLNGYNDWFLPSLGELNLMYKNLHLAGLGGFLADTYWSSSRNAFSFADALRFSDGNQFGDTKTRLHLVRAVRAF